MVSRGILWQTNQPTPFHSFGTCIELVYPSKKYNHTSKSAKRTQHS
jgi:hypothetical protein